MAEKIFRAKDGTEFGTEKEADEYEAGLAEDEKICDFCEQLDEFCRRSVLARQLTGALEAAIIGKGAVPQKEKTKMLILGWESYKLEHGIEVPMPSDNDEKEQDNG